MLLNLFIKGCLLFRVSVFFWSRNFHLNLRTLSILIIILDRCEKYSRLIASLIVLTGIVFTVIAQENFQIYINWERVETKCGKDAIPRFRAWEELIRQNKNVSDRQKIESVNRFFNKVRFAEDIDVWGVQDYWANPYEFLCKNAGDCEDYAIAKYFTLKAMGMEEVKLYIMYVKVRRLWITQSHMVLAYYSHPGADPLILDNLINSVKPASKRTDLSPVFGFNGKDLWMAKQRAEGKPLTGSGKLTTWQNLLNKMSENNP